MRHPDLAPEISVDAGLNVSDLFHRFEVFEALHSGMRIASPMSSADLDEVVRLLAPQDGDVALDLGCGSGELLLRLSAAADVTGVGVDLSPWMIAAAHARAVTLPQTTLTWAVAEARNWPMDQRDLVACLGASWIWHGLDGTIRAIAARTAPGGRVAIGDMRRRDTVSAAELTRRHGPLPGAEEIDELFEQHGLDVLGRVTTTDGAWDEYLARTGASFSRWEAASDGERAAEFRDVQEEWIADQRRDREVLSWSVWVGRKR